MTPLMRQYWDIKSLHQDKILLFRMGDFFEMFFEDATTAAPLLGIALTQRNKKSADETPMCGMPHHSIAGPINKLLKSGLKVAICDQVEDPKMAKGIVKRAVTRVLTPGMVYDSETLDATISHYIAAPEKDILSCIDTTTGECLFYSDLSPKDLERLLEVLPIAEIVVEEEADWSKFGKLVSVHKELANHASLPESALRLLSYVQSLCSAEILKTLKPFTESKLQKKMDLSSTTLRHLEIFATYKGEGEGSLFHAMNRTRTSAGARLLRQWLCFPLTEKAEIEKRHEKVEAWIKNPGGLKKTREVLAQMGDIERRLSKIALPQSHARDLLALSQSIQAGISALRSAADEQDFSELLALSDKIEKTIVEEPPLQTRQGYMIRKGVSAALDEYIELSTDSQSLLMKMEESEKEKTGISSLKIRYNNVFGYYIEVTHTHKDKVPKHYMRKQTLTNAERYCTDELVELEKKVLSAQSKRADLEYEIFENLRQNVLAQASGLLTLAQKCSELDVITGLSWLAIEKKYVRPLFGKNLVLKSSRHTVVEQSVKKNFVPNDIELERQGCLLLTGPNMAGKSTLMRQVALSVILAQMGSFVPADSAELPLFDHIFTRIGASDQLSEGLSTFMVEMTETAEMMRRSNAQSLLILDEIGRGTSTFDGMSLAQAILEHILSDLKCMTFFATHYHELTRLEQIYPLLKNAHMSVSEKAGEIRFLHTLVKGPALRSYGIHVARLAGLPSQVTKRAEQLLKEKESQPGQQTQLSLMDIAQEPEEVEQKLYEGPIVPPALEKVAQELKEFSLTQKTPLEAMNQIARWQDTLT